MDMLINLFTFLISILPKSNSIELTAQPAGDYFQTTAPEGMIS